MTGDDERPTRGRRRIWAVLALLLCTAAGGCGSTSDDEPSATETPASDMTTRPRAAPEPGPKPVEQARIGDRLSFANEDVPLVVGLTRVVRVPSYDRPPEGTRYVGIMMFIRNAGEQVWFYTAGDTLQLIDSRGRWLEPAPGPNARTNCPAYRLLALSVKPDATKSICVPFVVERDAVARKFRFEGDRGHARWSLR